MADQQEAADKSQDPASASGETTPAAGASSTDVLQAMAAMEAKIMAEVTAAKKQAEGAAFLAKKSLSRTPAQQQAEQQEQAPDVAAQIWARQEKLEFRQSHPDLDQKKLAAIEEIKKEPGFAQFYGHIPDSLVANEAAYAELDRRLKADELANLQAAQQKINEAKDAARNNAFVSGQGASVKQEVISQDKLQKMTLKEMEEKFGTDALLGGVLEGR